MQYLLFSLCHSVTSAKKLSAVKLLVSLLGFFLLASCSSFDKPEEWVLTGSIMGTSYTVTIIGPPKGADRIELQQHVFAALSQVDGLMSTYKADSEVSRFNRFQEDSWFTLSPETFSVVQLAQEVSQLSGGSFDVTVAPLIELWGFGQQGTDDVIPSDKMVELALQKIGFQHLLLDASSSAVKKRKPVTINLSAVAKGYGVDLVAERLMALNLKCFLIEVGGEVWAKGLKPGKQPWRVAVESPDGDFISGDVETDVGGIVAGRPVLVQTASVRIAQKIINISDVGVATSGDYRNFFEKEGQRYSHTIDPGTGKPVKHNVVSVSVIDQSTARADAWATALLVMGAEMGMAVAQRNELAVFFIVRTETGFAESMTANFKQYLVN